MRSPPETTDNRTSAAVDRRKWKAARRSALVQCKKCCCSGTGVLNARRRLASVNLAATLAGPGRWRHDGCGGTFAAYDIEVGP